MIWVGLTGGIATGKSTVSGFFRSFGVPVADADQFAREAVQKGSPGLNEVVQAFGPGVLQADGELDRKKMGALTFSDSKARERLEKIIHPRVQAMTQDFRYKCEKSNAVMAIYDVPLLFEKNLEAQYTLVIVVACTREQQIERLTKRNGLSLAEAEARLKAQIPIEEKVKRADYIIENQGTLDELKLKTRECMQWLKEKKR